MHLQVCTCVYQATATPDHNLHISEHTVQSGHLNKHNELYFINVAISYYIIAMATASGMPDRQQRLLQLIECPICLNELQDPRLLSCRHIYCYKCLKDYHKKGNHGNALLCPQCREVTTIYQGGVNNLPKFFFVNELKEVVMATDRVRKDKPQEHRGVVCSTEACGQPALKYCKQCEFLCQQSYDDHSKSRVTKSHNVIPASEGEAFTKSKVPAYPPCHRHKHYLMDLYCLICDQPMCNTCSYSIHDGHKRCELDKQAEVCKTQLEQIYVDTDGLIDVVKQAMDDTTSQVKQAEVDFDEACDNVKSTFKILHDKLDEEEQKMLSDIRKAVRSVKKKGNVTLDGQSMTLSCLESLKSCQIKLINKDSPYDFVTFTDSIKRYVNNHYNKELPGIMWTSQIKMTNKSTGLRQRGRVDLSESVVTRNVEVTGAVASDKQVEVTGSVVSDKQVEVTGSVASDKQVEVKEVSRIRLHAQNKGAVEGIVVYNQRVYVVNGTGLIVYCYTPDGSLSHKYDHKSGEKACVWGMCLIKEVDTAMLVVSNVTSKSHIWIKIIDDVTMAHQHTQQLDYSPRGVCNDQGDLLVCDVFSHKIHRYRHDGQTLAVIDMPGNVMPSSVTRHGDLYILSDFMNDHAVMIDNKGQVMTP